jgi:hypothetical protein
MVGELTKRIIHEVAFWAISESTVSVIIIIQSRIEAYIEQRVQVCFKICQEA